MAANNFALDYIDVATRIVEFRSKHPEGSLQQISLEFREVNGSWWVIYTAAAYRTPDDQRPGHGTAWEPVPGKTNFTRDSELQNAETAAWGRAIVAALAADTKKGIASAEEVRNRREAEDQSEGQGRPMVTSGVRQLQERILEIGEQKRLSKEEIIAEFDVWKAARGMAVVATIGNSNAVTLQAFVAHLLAEKPPEQNPGQEVLPGTDADELGPSVSLLHEPPDDPGDPPQADLDARLARARAANAKHQ